MSQQPSAEDHFRQGEQALASVDAEQALEHFRAAHRLDEDSARYRSFYGLALGLFERRWEEAIEMCRSAARDEFFDPVHYHNLARLHLAFGFKAEAVRLLRRGLMIDPENVLIHRALAELGMRRSPPLSFLRRGHAVNRWLGRARDWALWRSGEPEVAIGQ